MKYDVIIIGGGAAGLAGAARLDKSGKNINVCLLDAGERFGKKLAASGNGQGNVSNTDMTVGHYHGGNLRRVEKIACADAYAGVGLFNCLFAVDDRGRIYPAGKQASALVDDLLNSLKTSRFTLSTGRKVEKIKTTASGFEVPAGVPRQEPAQPARFRRLRLFHPTRRDIRHSAPCP